MRLIDLDALLQYPIRLDHYDKKNGNKHFVLGIESVLKYAQYLPIIETEAPKTGEWINGITITALGNYIHQAECSACHSPQTFHIGIPYYRFCPICGAMMKNGCWGD